LIGSSVPAFADHFSGHAGEYAAHRPSYPVGLIEYLASLCPRRQLAWDAGTGSGQAALLVAERFDRVRATDASAEQIRHAQPHTRVEYRVGLAHESGLGKGAVDLVTVAQALHWFDLTKFYAEVRRVLREGGVVAAWCYGNAVITPEVDAVIARFYSDRVGRFWPPERRHVETGYCGLDFPFDEQRSPAFAIEAQLTGEEFLGYVATWSSVAAARKAEGRDPLVDLGPELLTSWPVDKRRLVTWPIGLRVGIMSSRA
jgi:SAM-dependent methyltransferase